MVYTYADKLGQPGGEGFREVGALVAHFCFVEMGESDQQKQLVATIEAALAAELPEV